MNHGFIKVAAITPKIKVADPFFNAGEICKHMHEAKKNKAKVMVFPELCITGYTCNDLFLQETLLQDAIAALRIIVAHSADVDALVFVGLPFEKNGKLYNVAAVINRGELLAFVPKMHMPNYAEFYESRHFVPGNAEPWDVLFDGKYIPFGTNLLFESEAVKGFVVAAEICEDLWVANTPGTAHALAGATVLVNLSASNETIAKDSYRNTLVQSTSARLISAYIYANAGEGESTQDLVFAGHNLICENGVLLNESDRFENQTIYADIDIYKIRNERRRNISFDSADTKDYKTIFFQIKKEETRLERYFPKMPFVPMDMALRKKRCDEILSIQSFGLKKRLEHTGSKRVVIGISGGLDSTLALLVAVKAFDALEIDRKNILAVTMPCFGTTSRTYDNACTLSNALGVSLEEVDITEAVTLHFKDISHDINKHDITFENGQARERTQVLMDIANRENGFVIGTGDMSELALGWATYNGDHMSMYGVNVGVPKTLVRHLVSFYADTVESETLKTVLYDVLDTPVSPELLPPTDGVISQKTEEVVGPYELHDFFLYYMLRCGFAPDKVLRLAVYTFEQDYDLETIRKWLHVFYKRFFAQQFKRSCLPDGPKVGSVSVSPRGDLRMPSDASVNSWLAQLEKSEI